MNMASGCGLVSCGTVRSGSFDFVLDCPVGSCASPELLVARC